MKTGDKIHFLSEYTLLEGTILSVGPKRLKIFVPAHGFFTAHEVRIPFEKCALPTELVCVVWEKWKGGNGRGGYRLEKILYANLQQRASDWPRNALVYEDAYGQLTLNKVMK